MLVTHIQNAEYVNNSGYAEGARDRILSFEMQPECRDATATNIYPSDTAGVWPAPTRRVVKRIQPVMAQPGKLVWRGLSAWSDSIMRVHSHKLKPIPFLEHDSPRDYLRFQTLKRSMQ